MAFSLFLFIYSVLLSLICTYIPGVLLAVSFVAINFLIFLASQLFNQFNMQMCYLFKQKKNDVYNNCFPFLHFITSFLILKQYFIFSLFGFFFFSKILIPFTRIDSYLLITRIAQGFLYFSYLLKNKQIFMLPEKMKAFFMLVNCLFNYINDINQLNDLNYQNIVATIKNFLYVK